ncbi:MAG: RpiB/LacA/LacB family sugar-phosphate isomerase, partial [Blastomonas fulva]
NNANVIAMGARLIGIDTAKDCLATFLATPFEGGRHERRVAKLTPA